MRCTTVVSLIALIPLGACTAGGPGAARPTRAETVAATTDVVTGSREGTAAGLPDRGTTSGGAVEGGGEGGRVAAPGAEYARPCPTSVARLASWSDVRVPGVYWLDMRRAEGGWEPAEPIAMPHNHATRLELTNVAEVPLLGRAVGARARVVVELTDRDLEKDDSRATWFATYRARVVEVCAPP